MRLSSKHGNEQTITLYDFTGGINSSISPENIKENQLLRASNLEVDPPSGLLKTVSGTKRIMRTEFKIFSAGYDRINNCGIVVSDKTTTDSNHYVYKYVNGEPLKKIGTLTGEYKPIYCAWDRGILIASGGKLQYYNGSTLETLSQSPACCSSVYVRNGRIVVADVKANKIFYSAVGDEKKWNTPKTEEITDAEGKWIETGYKDGGRFIGMANLSDNIIIFKDNGYVYRLNGNYPNWEMHEISRQVDCGGRLSFCSLPNTVVVMGERNIQLVDTTQDYSDIKVASVSTPVANLLKDYPLDAELVYLPPLNQIWIIGTHGQVLIFDCTFQSFFARQFHSQVVTVTYHKNTVLVIKEHGIYKLDSDSFTDEDDRGEEAPLTWNFTSRRLVANNEYLIKRAQINVMPSFTEAEKDFIMIGRIHLGIPTKARKYADDSEFIYCNEMLIFNDIQKVFPEVSLTNSVRQIARSKAITVKGNGKHGRLLINSIKFTVAEV